MGLLDEKFFIRTALGASDERCLNLLKTYCENCATFRAVAEYRNCYTLSSLFKTVSNLLIIRVF